MDDREIVDALCDIEDGMSEWEVDFVDSLDKQLRSGSTLSPKQRAKADQIWEAKG